MVISGSLVEPGVNDFGRDEQRGGENLAGDPVRFGFAALPLVDGLTTNADLGSECRNREPPSLAGSDEFGWCFRHDSEFYARFGTVVNTYFDLTVWKIGVFVLTC